MHLKVAGLVRAFAFKYDLEGFQNQGEVVAQFSVALDVVVVQAHLAFEADVAAAADLPNAGETWCYGKTHAVPGLVFRHFGRNRRARAHDRHVALENVEELRKFVEAELAEYVAEGVDARVVLHLEGLAARLVLGQQFFLALFGVCVHAAELVHGEQLAVLAYAGLLEDDRTLGVADLDCCGAEEKQGRAEHNRDARAGHVHKSLDHVAVANGVGVFPDMVQVQACEREESPVGAVKVFNLVFQFQVFFFLEPRIDVGLEDGLLGVDAQCLDQTCIVQLVQDFFADGFQNREVGIQQDDAETATVRKVAQHIDKAQVRKHGQNADSPGVFDGLVGAAPTKEVVLVRIHLDVQEWLTGAVRPHKLFIQTRSKELCRIDNVLQFLLVEN